LDDKEFCLFVFSYVFPQGRNNQQHYSWCQHRKALIT